MFSAPPPILDRKLRFAVVGCGRISVNHFDALTQHHDRAEVVAVCDVALDALKAKEHRAARAGKHVVTEKPMATRWDDAWFRLVTRQVCICSSSNKIDGMPPYNCSNVRSKLVGLVVLTWPQSTCFGHACRAITIAPRGEEPGNSMVELL